MLRVYQLLVLVPVELFGGTVDVVEVFRLGSLTVQIAYPRRLSEGKLGGLWWTDANAYLRGCSWWVGQCGGEDGDTDDVDDTVE